jgi:transcriptional regulator with XRE-family HTH domain
MDILSVLKRHGHTTYTLAKEMDIKQSTLSNMLNGNPTVKSLKLMAEKMPCSVAEFFLDELTEKDLETMLEIVRNRDNQQQAVEQPKENEQSSSALTADVAFICPHCHEAIKLGFVK